MFAFLLTKLGGKLLPIAAVGAAALGVFLFVSWAIHQHDRATTAEAAQRAAQAALVTFQAETTRDMQSLSTALLEARKRVVDQTHIQDAIHAADTGTSACRQSAPVRAALVGLRQQAGAGHPDPTGTTGRPAGLHTGP
jgi:hypothetical protein